MRTIFLFFLFVALTLNLKGQYKLEADSLFVKEMEIVSRSINEYVNSLSKEEIEHIRKEVNRKYDRINPVRKAQQIDSISFYEYHNKKQELKAVKNKSISKIEESVTHEKRNIEILTDSLNRDFLKQYVLNEYKKGDLSVFKRDSINFNKTVQNEIKKEKNRLINQFEKQLESLEFNNSDFSNQMDENFETLKDNTINLKTKNLNTKLEQLKSVDQSIGNTISEKWEEKAFYEIDSYNKYREQVYKNFGKGTELLNGFKQFITAQDFSTLKLNELGEIWNLFLNASKLTKSEVKSLASKNIEKNKNELNQYFEEQTKNKYQDILLNLNKQKDSLMSKENYVNDSIANKIAVKEKYFHKLDSIDSEIKKYDDLYQELKSKLEDEKEVNKSDLESFISSSNGILNINFNKQNSYLGDGIPEKPNELENENQEELLNKYFTQSEKELKESVKNLKFSDKTVNYIYDSLENKVDSVSQLEIRNKKLFGYHDFSLGSLADLENRLTFNYNIAHELNDNYRVGLNVQSILEYENIGESLKESVVGSFFSARLYKSYLDFISESKFGLLSNQKLESESKREFGLLGINVGLQPKIPISKVMSINVSILYKVYDTNNKPKRERLNFRIGLQKNIQKIKK